MVYTLEEGNIIREYKVFYDEERLRELLDFLRNYKWLDFILNIYYHYIESS